MKGRKGITRGLGKPARDFLGPLAGVATVLFWHAAQRPQRILQAFRERHKTLAAEHHVGTLEARER